MTGRLTNPMGCRSCGIDRPHGWQYLPDVGLHQWEQPTQQQIKDRMLARRAARNVRPRQSPTQSRSTS